MYITINDVIGEKRIDLSYPIEDKDIAVVSMLSDNFRYWLQGSIEVLLKTHKKIRIANRFAPLLTTKTSEVLPLQSKRVTLNPHTSPTCYQRFHLCNRGINIDLGKIDYSFG